MKTNRYLFACLIATCVALSAAAQAPGIISHQGKVTVAGTNYTGAASFKFALVNAAGDTSYWSNDGTSAGGSQPTAAVSLDVARGVFSVNLGDTALTNMTTIPASAFSTDAVYLRVWFNDGVNGSQLLAPDRRITSVAYALKAASAASYTETDPVFGASAAGGIAGSDITAWNAKVSSTRSISTTAPLTGGGDLSANRTLSLAQATGSADGYLASADWTTFNSKVGGSGTASYVPKFTASGTVGNSALFSAADGNVGIGTTTPVSKLHIAGADMNNALLLENTSANPGRNYILFKTLGTEQGYIGLGGGATDHMSIAAYGAANNIFLETGGFVRMTVLPSGNVGIGTTTPAYKLDVAGSINGTAITINGTPVASSTDTYWSTAGSGRIQYSGGNVGVGVSTPAYRLDVAGDLNLTGSLRFNGAAFAPVTSVTASGPLASSGGTTPNLTLQTASGSQAGALSSADWTTFNNKVGGSGTASYVPKFTASGTVGNSALFSDASGKVGIGTTAPYTTLTVGSSDATARITAGGANTHLTLASAGPDGSIYLNAGGVANDNYSTSTRLTVGANGNVGIGTANPVSKLHVNGDISIPSSGDPGEQGGMIRAVGFYGSVANIPSAIEFRRDNLSYTGEEGQIRFKTTNVPTPTPPDRMVILGNGNVGIGTTTPSYTLHVNGSVAGTSAYNNLSDARLKKDVQPIGDALAIVAALRGVTFNWDPAVDPAMKLDDRNHVGFLAQEVEAVLPQAVSTASDARQTKSVAYSEVIPVLTEAIKQLKAENDELKARLAAIEAKLSR